MAADRRPPAGRTLRVRPYWRPPPTDVSFRLLLSVLLVAPGVAIHELGHWLLCRWSGVEVRRVVLFQVGSPAGFVSHAAPRLLRQHLAISSGPLVVSSLAAETLFGAAGRLLLERPAPWWPVGLILAGWLGWSIALEAWPSGGDAVALQRSAQAQLRQFHLAAALALLLAWLLRLVHASRRLGGHWLYAGGLAAIALRLAAG